MPKNERKYLAFPSVNFFKRLYSARQRLYLSNSNFSKISIEQMFLNVKKYHFLTLKKNCFKKYHFLTLKKNCSIEFLENKELKGQVYVFTLCLHKFMTSSINNRLIMSLSKVEYKRELVTTLRSPLMKTLDRSVETLGLELFLL